MVYTLCKLSDQARKTMEMECSDILILLCKLSDQARKTMEMECSGLYIV